MSQLTSYIASDPKAMAFLHGKPEHDGPYTMRVNPAYQDIALPVDSWPQLDTWQFKAAPNSCLKAQGKSMPPYMPLIASPTSSMQLVAQALLYNWPNVGTGCTGTGTDQDPYQLARVAPQGVGNRFMLGLVTLGDAQRYGLSTATLQAAPGHYVAGEQRRHQRCRRPREARPRSCAPGTSPRPRSGSRRRPTRARCSSTRRPRPTASPPRRRADVAQFIRVSSTEGQVPGRGNGQLAAGYLPITRSGVTKGLYLAGAAGGRGRRRPEGPAGAAPAPAAAVAPPGQPAVERRPHRRPVR